MTRENVQSFLAMIQGAYPNFNPADKTLTVNVWAMALEDCEPGEVIKAFKVYMRSDTSGFAPVPGQIIDIIYSQTVKPLMNENEAWNLVLDAISESKQDIMPTQHFNALPEIIKKAVGGTEAFRDLFYGVYRDEKKTNNAKQSFVKCYNQECDRKHRFDKLSPRLGRQGQTHVSIGETSVS